MFEVDIPNKESGDKIEMACRLPNSAYLVLGYACNQKCKCCPVNKVDSPPIIPYCNLKEDIHRILEMNISAVTLSGGEPTLHPNFLDVVQEFVDGGMAVDILSNGELFSDYEFSDRFLQIAKNKPVSVTTTLHSHIATEHEKQNSSAGSFLRSTDGLQYLDKNSINISIKHCITRNNYRDLTGFVKYVLDNFTDNTEIQLWGLDLRGIEPSVAKYYFVGFNEIQPYFQEAIDYFETRHGVNKRILSVNNLPLCMCDCYYWKYFTSYDPDYYLDYRKEGFHILDCDSGPFSYRCNSCIYRLYCPGIYQSNYEIMGSDIVSPPFISNKIHPLCTHYVCYNMQNIDLKYLSPYSNYQLRKDGLIIRNSLTNLNVLLRLRAEDIVTLQKGLEEGISESSLVLLFEKAGFDGESIVNELVLKGIIE